MTLHRRQERFISLQLTLCCCLYLTASSVAFVTRPPIIRGVVPGIYTENYKRYSSSRSPRSKSRNQAEFRPLHSDQQQGDHDQIRSDPMIGALHNDHDLLRSDPMIGTLHNTTSFATAPVSPAAGKSHQTHFASIADSHPNHIVSNLLEDYKNSEPDVFGSSLLLERPDDDTSSSRYNITSQAAANLPNNSNTNNNILGANAMGDLLKILGPLTLSDPAFSLGIGEVEKQPYKLPLSLLETQQFFSASQLKLPRLTLRFRNATNTSSGILVPVFENNDNATNLLPLAATDLLSLVNTTSLPLIGTTVTTGNNASATYNNSNTYLYDPFAFWDEQANYTKQQMEAAQRAFFDYSVSASRQLDEAQKAFLEYGAKAIAVPSSGVGGGVDMIGGIISNNNNNKVLSIEELEAYLRLNGYVKQSELGQASSGGDLSMSQEVPTSMGVPISQFGRGRGRVLRGKEKSGFQAVGISPTSAEAIASKGVVSTSSSTVLPAKQQPKGRVAFPQPSVMSYSKLKWGSAVSASFLGLLGSLTISSNLWLLGSIFGGLYGYDISKNIAERPPSNALNNLIVYMGREVTSVYLMAADWCNGIWFMYRTGQLSYEYWQKYAVLDEQFAIQSKIDMWNAKFLKGKENFDKWEQDNEVGRKVLAGLRTAWLVEEAAFKKSLRQKKSRYRIVQWFYDGNRYIRMKIKYIYSKRGQAWKEVQDLAEGMRQEIIDPSKWQQSIWPRVVAGLAALIFANLTGVLFSVSPALLGVAAVVLGGVVWPTWFSEWLGRVASFLDDTKAMGRGEDLGELLRKTLPGPSNKKKMASSSLPKGRGEPTSRPESSPAFSWPFGDKKEKDRYSYYRRSDGSKRWYRAGRNPWDLKSSLTRIFGKKEEEERPWWSLN